DLEDQRHDAGERSLSGELGRLGRGNRIPGRRARRSPVYELYGADGRRPVVRHDFFHHGVSASGGIPGLPLDDSGNSRHYQRSGEDLAAREGPYEEMMQPERRRLTMSATWLRYALATAGMLLPLLAQQGRGTISGTVTDTQGGAIPAVSVEIKNTGTNAVFRA